MAIKQTLIVMMMMIVNLFPTVRHSDKHDSMI